jgi:tetratricopeptide (TPR) repeat protein
MERVRITLALATAMTLGSVSSLGVSGQRLETRAGRAATPATSTAAVSNAAGPSSSIPTDAGQTPPSESESIRRELTHTDRVIAVLKPKVFRTGNSQAQSRFGEAVAREKEARDAFSRSLYARATRLTREARSLAREASVMVGPPEDDPIYVGRAIDNAEDALSLARDVFDQGANPAVWRRYEALRGDLQEARRQLEAGEAREAYRQAVQVRDGVLDLLQDSQNLPVPASTAERALKQAQEAYDRATRELGANPKQNALRWRREALGQLAKAKSAFQHREYRDSILHAKLVERSLDEAITAQRNAEPSSNGAVRTVRRAA